MVHIRLFESVAKLLFSLNRNHHSLEEFWVISEHSSINCAGFANLPKK